MSPVEKIVVARVRVKRFLKVSKSIGEGTLADKQMKCVPSRKPPYIRAELLNKTLFVRTARDRGKKQDPPQGCHIFPTFWVWSEKREENCAFWTKYFWLMKLTQM